MVAKRLEPLHPPNGRAERVRRAAILAGALAALAFAGAAVVNEFGEPARLASGDEARRVFYVSYVDEADDDRGRINFGRLKDALNSLDANGTTAPFVLDFVQVVVGGPQTIAGTLSELVQRKPAAIVATSDDVLQAAKAATQSIPILFMSYGDPVETGDVRSIAAPGVRRTGFTIHVPMLQKAIELLIDGYPAAKHIGVLVDSLAASQPGQRRQFQEARSAFARDVQVFVADNEQQLDDILRAETARSMDAWIVPAGAALWANKEAVIHLMASTSKPVLYDRTSLVRDGALMSYEARIVDPFRIWANQLLLILEGVDAATIPVERPSQFELALNLDAIASNPRLRPSKRLIQWANVLFSAKADKRMTLRGVPEAR